MTEVVVYSKENCHLCERVITELRKLRAERPFDLSIEDITKNPELCERYGNIIPVVALDGIVRLAGAVLANPNTLEVVLRKALPPND